MDALITCGGERRPVRFGPKLDVDVDYNVLGSYGADEITAHHVDLLRLAATVALADRWHRRTPAVTGWARHLAIEMPVQNPERWAAAAQALADCLEYVSGDHWVFAFIPGQALRIQRTLLRNTEFSVVVPFSGGLDSHLLKEDLLARGERPLLVTARTSAFVSRAAHDAAHAPGHEAGIPVRLKSGPHAEDTFRTRTFLFGCAAAVAAVIAGTNRIEIAENGQGSIGASLVPFGAEVPYRTTHPLFTERLRRFLAAVGIDVRFAHPYMWRTKGSVLADLRSRGHAGAWHTTTSCSRNMPRTKSVPDKRACGICGNCMLRRVAVHAAGQTEALAYHWDLRASDLGDAVLPGGSARTTATDRGIAARGVIGMQAFASMRADDPALRRNAHTMATFLNVAREDVVQKQAELRAQHAAEWRAFLESLPHDSWVRRYAEDADALAA